MCIAVRKSQFYARKHRIGVSVDNEFLHVTLHNQARGITESRPASKACQHVTSVIDSKFSVHSSEREQRILKVGLAPSCEMYADSDQSFCDLHVCFQKLRDYFNMQYELRLTCVSNGALTSPNAEVGALFEHV